MTDLEDRLALFLGEDTPPARDPAFQLDLMAAIERRRVRDQVLLLSAICVLTSAMLWSFGPVLIPLAVEYGPVVGGFATAVALVWASLVAVRQTVQA